MPFGNLPSCLHGRIDGRGRRVQQPLWQRRAVQNLQFSNTIQEKWSKIQNIIERHLSASIAFSFVSITFIIIFFCSVLSLNFFVFSTFSLSFQCFLLTLDILSCAFFNPPLLSYLYSFVFSIFNPACSKTARVLAMLTQSI